MPKITVLINLLMGVSFYSLSRISGAYAMLKMNLCRLLSALKISTGQLMLSTDYLLNLRLLIEGDINV